MDQPSAPSGGARGDGDPGTDLQHPHDEQAAGKQDVDEPDDLDQQDFERRVARRKPGAEVESLLRQARDLVEEARSGHFSAAVKIDRETLLQVLDEAIERLPEELRGARWMLKERDEFLARTHREADEILATARGQAERMVQRSEVLRSAENKARRIVERARGDAARIRNECDDYCDQRLAQFEAALERTMRVVSAGRRKLRPAVARPDRVGQASSSPSERVGSEELTNGHNAGPAKPTMFDQDRA